MNQRATQSEPNEPKDSVLRPFLQSVRDNPGSTYEELRAIHPEVSESKFRWHLNRLIWERWVRQFKGMYVAIEGD